MNEAEKERIRAEIERQEKWLLQAGYNTYNVDIAFSSIKSELKKALEQEPCENCISRQAALDAIGNVSDYGDGMVWEALSHAQRDVALLPPVTPQQRTGHWIEHEHNGIGHIECSECQSWFLMAHLLKHNYCPNCGAKMFEPQESEDNE